MSNKKFITLLQQKRGYFESLLDLTEEESHLPVPDWLVNLEKKTVLLNCIDEVDDEIHTYQQQFSRLPQEITEELDAIHELIGRILHLDAKNLEYRKRSFDGL